MQVNLVIRTIKPEARPVRWASTILENKACPINTGPIQFASGSEDGAENDINWLNKKSV